jgi:hypothetical protein
VGYVRLTVVLGDYLELQLSKEDEATSADDTEVRREDQEKINRFSKLHQRESKLEEQLKAKRVSIDTPNRRIFPNTNNGFLLTERQRRSGGSLDRTHARRRR